MPAIKLQIKSLLMHGTVGTMLAYLNYHTYIVFVVAFTVVYGFGSGSDWLLFVVDYYYYHYLFDNQ